MGLLLGHQLLLMGLLLGRLLGPQLGQLGLQYYTRDVETMHKESYICKTNERQIVT
jgi:hypothetical protein